MAKEHGRLYTKGMRSLENRGQFRTELVEGRSLQAVSGVSGGYLVGPGQLFGEMVTEQGMTSTMRRICRTLPPIEEDDLPIPAMETTLDNAEWIGELGTGTADTTSPFGRRTLYPHLLNKRIRVSKKMLRSPMAEVHVFEALNAAIAYPQEVAFCQGSGVGEPVGIINTPGLAVFESSIANYCPFDDVRQFIFSLPARFLARATILTSTNFMKFLADLKDGEGNFVMPEFRGSIENVPVAFTEGLPEIANGAALVGGQIAAVIGDFRNYWIGDGAMVLHRLEELYAATNEVGFQMMQETDAMAVTVNAFYALRIKD